MDASLLHLSNPQRLYLKGLETGGKMVGGRLVLLAHGEPALQAYPDSTGTWTIGWGATGRDILKGVTWTRLHCEIRFEADVSATEASVRACLRVPTSQGQFDALVLLAFNLGSTGLRRSTLLELHNRGDFHGAALQFAQLDHSKGKVLRGLTERRAYEQALYTAEGV